MTPVRNLLVICAVAGILVLSRAEALDRLSQDIAAQPLAQALSEFANQTGLQLIYVSEVAATQASKGTPRGLAAPDALRHLLAGTGLGFQFLNERTVRIFAASGCDSPSGCIGPPFGAATRAPAHPSARRSPPDLLEDVIVTGTRRWLDPTVGVAPVTVLDRRDIERGGANSIGRVLQALPLTTGSPLNTNVNAPGSAERYDGPEAGGDGSVRVELHGLDTVVLLNGRRLPNASLGADASVDLNTLPLSFIERVEVLASGASAIYGADAVGGVVNIVTRRDNHGLELAASRTITGHGDGEIITGQAAIGFELLGGAWSVGVDYTKVDGVTLDRRGYSAMPLAILDTNETTGPIGIFATPDGHFLVPDGNALGLMPGRYTRVTGATGQVAADYRPYVHPSDSFNTAPFNYSQTPNERASLWLLGSRPLGGSTNFFMEGLVHQRNSEQQAAPELTYGEEIPADNYYNPFGVDLLGAARRFVEAGERSVSEDVELWRALIGLEGAVGRWTWEFALSSAKSEAATVESGFFSMSRLESALGPSGPDDSGRIVCGPPDPATGRVPAESIIPDCVPLNLFGGRGSITREQLDYVSPRPMTNTGTNEQRIAEFALSGPGGRVLGRDLHWVLGANYRRDAGKLALDPLHALEFEGFGMPATASQLGGHYDATELFAELQVPLLRDRRWAREIAVNLVVRWSDYSSFDQNTSWQAGLRWQPTEELTLRANYAEVFRVPTIVELYERLPPAKDFWDFDPCGNEPTHRQQVNCAANGVPGGAYVQGEEVFPVPYGGNPELEPETGHSFGAGLIYTPAWGKGLFASIDFFQVELTNYITQAYPYEVLFECAEHGTRELCDDIRRFPDGRISQVSTFTENFGGLEVRGVDMAIEMPLATRLGEVNSRLLATYLDRWNVQPFPGGAVHGYAGNYKAGARPRLRISGNIDWRYGPWMASYAAEYIGSFTERVHALPDVFGFPFDDFNRQVEAVLYHDIDVGFEFDTGVRVRAAITNITDEDPPYVNIPPANTDVATYRMLGRSYFLELRYQVN